LCSQEPATGSSVVFTRARHWFKCCVHKSPSLVQVLCSQEPATSSYPEAYKFNPNPPSDFLKIHFYFIFPSTPRHSKLGSSLHFFLSKFCTNSYLPSVLNSPPISSFSILSC